MDTTQSAAQRRPYTSDDSQDGIILSILLGVILGFCATAFSMITGISLDNVMLIVGASTVGTSMFMFGMYGDVMRRRQFDQLFGFVTTVVISIGVYGLMQLI